MRIWARIEVGSRIGYRSDVDGVFGKVGYKARYRVQKQC